MRRLTTAEAGPGRRDAQKTFEAFFQEEHARLLRALYLITTDRSEAEDVTQEALLRVWERWSRVRRMENPTGYLYRVALNISRSRARSVSRSMRRVLWPMSPVDPLAVTEDRDAVVRALRTLTPRQRAALVLTELLDMDVASTAQALGIKEGTVRSLVSQARSAMRSRLEKLDE
jgi:RNA polymerase sigma-70 factor (ECF subfamily)